MTTSAAQAAERRATVVRTVNEVSPPHCDGCNAPLTTTTELNRRIDWALDQCDTCVETAGEGFENECWCVYGWFINGDPRQFEPDEENSEGEIAAWRTACEAWSQGKYVNPAAEEHGPWVESTGRVTIGERPSPEAIGHCSAPRAYGMGALHCDIHKAPLDAWRSWPIRHAELADAEAQP